jgi:hypothetical protein
MQQELGTDKTGPEAGKDKPVWQDAVETLPGEADPEEGDREGARHVVVRQDGSEEGLSPMGSSVGSSVGAQAEQRGEDRLRGSVSSVGLGLHDQYFAVSVSLDQRRPILDLADPVDRELSFAEKDGEEQLIEDSLSQAYTGPNSAMQLVRKEVQLREAQQVVAQQEQVGDANLEHERQELAKVRAFCASILKSLAPPLLHEIEKATKLRAEGEPFTPKRVTRRTVATGATTQVKKASTAENALLKALGICPENLSASDEDLERFRGFFDSPIRDSHLRVLASIFGKELPLSFERQEYCRVAVPAQ